jgi:hypothetical protein
VKVLLALVDLVVHDQSPPRARRRGTDRRECARCPRAVTPRRRRWGVPAGEARLFSITGGHPRRCVRLTSGWPFLRAWALLPTASRLADCARQGGAGCSKEGRGAACPSLRSSARTVRLVCMFCLSLPCIPDPPHIGARPPARTSTRLALSGNRAFSVIKRRFPSSPDTPNHAQRKPMCDGHTNGHTRLLSGAAPRSVPSSLQRLVRVCRRHIARPLVRPRRDSHGGPWERETRVSSAWRSEAEERGSPGLVSDRKPRLLQLISTATREIHVGRV